MMSFRSHLHANLSVACLKNISVILSSRFDSGLSRMLVKRSMWLVRLSEDLASLIVAGVYLRHHIFVVHLFVVRLFSHISCPATLFPPKASALLHSTA